MKHCERAGAEKQLLRVCRLKPNGASSQCLGTSDTDLPGSTAVGGSVHTAAIYSHKNSRGVIRIDGDIFNYQDRPGPVMQGIPRDAQISRLVQADRLSTEQQSTSNKQACAVIN